nr:MAG TPA: hypothetical protein [Caudoviricetes sp.]
MIAKIVFSINTPEVVNVLFARLIKEPIILMFILRRYDNTG